jgi:hypothetical protein
MEKIITIINGGIYTEIKVGPLTRVDVSDWDHGVTARGYAKHHFDDLYEEEFGIKLATARAYSRLNSKIAKKLARETPAR